MAAVTGKKATKPCTITRPRERDGAPRSTNATWTPCSSHCNWDGIDPVCNVLLFP